MPRTVGEVLTSVRDVLQDSRDPTVAPYRHSTAKLLRYLNSGLASARRLRPDLFFPSAAETDYAFGEADVSTPFPVEFSYVPVFVDYIAGMVSLEEDEYVAEGRAAGLLSRFVGQLVGKGV